MKKKLLSILLLLCCALSIQAQYDRLTSENGSQSFSPGGKSGARDTTRHKQIPRGITVWTIDPITGTRSAAEPDTTSYLRMNHVLNEGIYGEYNTLGNNGSPRLNRIFIDRNDEIDFIFQNPLTQIDNNPSDFHFTNTFSPITNLQYDECGDKLTGEDHLKAIFAVNVNKQLGFGFKFDYLYGRGYYSNQSTSHFGYTMWGSYLGDRYQAHLLMGINHQKVSENGGIKNDDYIEHPDLFSESFQSSEIPVFLERNWNRHNKQQLYFNQRYSLGFYRRVKMTEKEIEAKKFAMESQKEQEAKKKQEEENGDASTAKRRNQKKQAEETAPQGRPKNAVIMGNEPGMQSSPTDSTRIQLTAEAAKDSIQTEKVKKEEDPFMKDEFVPVTSLFHTMKISNYKRNYIAYQSPKDYYLNDFYALPNDSINDQTNHLHIRNYLGISLLEGFNKWAKAGLTGYISHELKHFELPNIDTTIDSWNENNVSLGAQLTKHEGKTLHFDANGDFVVLGTDIGQIDINGGVELNVPLFGDTVSVKGIGSYGLTSPFTYLTKYRSRHFAWDLEDAKKESRVHIEGIVEMPRTSTKLRVALDNISNYTYLGIAYNRTQGTDKNYTQTGTVITANQHDKDIRVLTAALEQNFKLGILHWDNIVTYQSTSDEIVLPLPKLNIYSTLYLRFKIARVLDCDFGVDARYFTKYYAPEYAPGVASFAVQQNEEVRTESGNYPFCNAYANFQLKNCRFFIMMSHVNFSDKGNYFTTPHNPMNQRVLRFGLNWNFFN